MFISSSSAVTKTQFLFVTVKTESLCLLLIFFLWMIVLQKLWNMLFISFEKLFLVLRYASVCISVLPLFLLGPHYLRGQSNNLGFWDPVSSNHLNSPNTIKQVKLNSWTVFTAKYQTIHKTRHFIIFQIYKEKNMKRKFTNITLSLRR